MELMADRWTDDRMDDLKSQVEGIDRRMEQGFRDLRVEMKEQTDGLRGEMNERFDRLDIRFDRMVYAILGFGASMFAAMMGLIAAVILSL